jgi:hypothetical protein
MLLTTRELSAVLMIPVRTLDNWRALQSGPPYYKLGHHVRYELATVLPRARTNKLARPKLPLGALGSVNISTLANGRIRARARIRDISGKLFQIRAFGGTEEKAMVMLRQRADRLLFGIEEPALIPASTIADACALWLERVDTSDLAASTKASYEGTIRLVLLPVCGGFPLSTLTVGRCDRIIYSILVNRSVAVARSARSVLSQVCATAVRQDVLASTRCATSPACPGRRRSSPISRLPRSRCCGSSSAPGAPVTRGRTARARMPGSSKMRWTS